MPIIILPWNHGSSLCTLIGFIIIFKSWSLSHSHISQKKSLRSISSTTSDGAVVAHDTRIQWAKEKNALVFIDLENVRGKAQFQLSHLKFLDQIATWTQFQGLETKVSLVVDHGTIPIGYYFTSRTLSVIFAGPRLKADDVIARDVAALRMNALVITADNDLMSRCRIAMNTINDGAKYEVQFLHPTKVLNDFEAIQRYQDSVSTIDTTNNTRTINQSHGTSNPIIPPRNNISISDTLLETIDEEIKIRGGLYMTENLMKKKINTNSPKSRRKLEKRARILCERLAQKSGGGQSIDQLTSIDDTLTEYDREFQNAVLEQWMILRKSATRKEMTGDRIMLAEHFRRCLESEVQMEEARIITTTSNIQDLIQLDEKNNANDIENKHSLHQDISPAMHHVLHVNNLMGIQSSSRKQSTLQNIGLSSSSSMASSLGHDKTHHSSKTSLRLVVISDTHGFEESLTPNGRHLPQGDVLLHLGDFAMDGSIRKKREAVRKFDEWLSLQTHRIKLVLRGNHDPFSVDFSKSNAQYYAGPKSISIDGKFVLTVVPYTSARVLSSSWRKLPMQYDILASHVPPYNILDKCYNGQHAGCNALRSKVERMIAGAPRLWLCGHIHESRGSMNVKFGISSRETLIINASNANSGRANRIEHGPTVVDLDIHGNVNIIHEDEMILESSQVVI